MSTLLINERPMMLLPSLAEKIGHDEAIVLQQIQYWIEKQEELENTRTYRDGRWWVYNTVDVWREKQFRWWSVPTLKRILQRLEKMGLVLTRRYEQSEWNQRKWYSIDYEAVTRLETAEVEGWKLQSSELIKVISGITSGDPSDPVKPESRNRRDTNPTPSGGSRRSQQRDQMNPSKGIDLIPSEESDRPLLPYTETTTETTTETKTDIRAESPNGLSLNQGSRLRDFWDQVKAVYNQNKPDLWTSLRSWNDERIKLASKWRKNYPDDEILLMIRDACMFASQDQFWGSKDFAISTLFRKSNLADLAEKWEVAQESGHILKALEDPKAIKAIQVDQMLDRLKQKYEGDPDA
jgi:hypothetical protein